MGKSGHESATGAGLEPLTDPDEQTEDFAEEHQRFVVEDGNQGNDGEQESPGRYDGGLDREGPP